MKFLLIGGTGFIGRYVARDLIQQGHRVTIYHRGQSTAALPDAVEHILGDRTALATASPQFQRFSPDVVVDFILSSEAQAVAMMSIFHGITGRVVALSSADVYRATGILHGLETGPLQPVPLTEDSDLRSYRQPYPKESLAVVRKIYPWVDDDYDKIPVENVVMNDARLPGTVLRLPMIYGPGDPLHRCYTYLKRMDDGRPAILLQENMAAWRGPRGYVENVAAAVALAALSPKAAARIYNVAEQDLFSERQWVEALGHAAGWTGSVSARPADLMPAHLASPANFAQHWTLSSARIREELGYREVVPLETALARTIEWERANPPAEIDVRQFDYTAEDAALSARQAN